MEYMRPFLDSRRPKWEVMNTRRYTTMWHRSGSGHGFLTST